MQINNKKKTGKQIKQTKNPFPPTQCVFHNVLLSYW